jgi:hypothetical protein
MICTFMPFFLLLIEARRRTGSLRERFSASYGTEHSRRGNQRQEAILGVDGRTRSACTCGVLLPEPSVI